MGLLKLRSVLSALGCQPTILENGKSRTTQYGFFKRRAALPLHDEMTVKTNAPC